MRKLYTNTIAFLLILLLNLQNIKAQVCGGTELVYSTGYATFDGYTSGPYILSTDLYIPSGGILTLENIDLSIMPDVRIIVAPGARLNIYGSHLHSCIVQPFLWRGIEVQVDDGGNPGLININSAIKSSFIEDALIAVHLWSEQYTRDLNSTNSFVLNIQNTIFNNNYTSIQLDNLNINRNVVYPNQFVIKGNVFTSRHIPFSSVSWPNVRDFKLTYDLISGAVNIPYSTSFTPYCMKAPYIQSSVYPISANPKPYSGSYWGSLLDFPYIYTGYDKPHAGVYLNNITSDDNSGFIIGQADAEPETNMDVQCMDYYGSNVDLGEGYFNPNMNLFDLQRIGIRTDNSSLVSYNNTFQNPGYNNLEWVGIETNNRYGLLNVTSPPLSGTYSGSSMNNAFFNMDWGIFSQGDNSMVVSNCDIREDPMFKTVRPTGGMYGIWVWAWDFDGVQIDSNRIFNLGNGIYYDASWGSNYGSLNADYNNIGMDVTGTLNTNGLYETDYGIILSQSGSATGYLGPLSCSNNNINLPEGKGGIQTAGWVNKDCNIMYNNIGGCSDFGIDVENCSSASNMATTIGSGGSIVYNNQLVGINQDVSQLGIHVEQSTNVQARCNNISLYNELFKYSNQHTASRCWGNIFLNGNYGLVLDASEIGWQGDASTTGFPSDNQWVGYWGNPSFPNNSTYTKNFSDARNSSLVVRDATIFNPGTGLSYGYSYPYTHAFGSLRSIWFTKATTYPNICDLTLTSWNNPTYEGRGAKPLHNKYTDTMELPDTTIYSNLQLAEALAKGEINIPSPDSAERIYTMQHQLYLNLMKDTMLLNKSSILQSFLQSHQYDSYSWIDLMDWVAANKDTATLGWVLANWQPQNKSDLNSQKYYSWVYKVQAKNGISTQDSVDMFALASACPVTDGNAVYKARNLYNRINKQFTKFSNSCSVGGPLSRKAIEPVVSDINIYPNPSKGQFNIKLPSNSSGKWQVKIVDMFGNTIIEKDMSNSNEVLGLNINAKPGIYSLQMINIQTGKQTIQKIEIQ